MSTINLRFRWTVSRARDTEGYNVCSLYAKPIFMPEKRVAACNGGGYDMVGTVVGEWVAKTFADRLRLLTRPFSGLMFVNPNHDPGNDEVPGTGKTVEEREAAGKSIGLERYQAAHKATAPNATEVHTIPYIDGGCGLDAVERIMVAIGVQVKWTYSKRGHDRVGGEVLVYDDFDVAKMDALRKRMTEEYAAQVEAGVPYKKRAMEVPADVKLTSHEKFWLEAQYPEAHGYKIRFLGEPPKFYECGICGQYHSVHFTGDCREDAQRFTIDQLEEKHGKQDEGWVEVDQEEADPVPLPEL